MLSSVYLCQQDQSLNSLQPLCNLLEKTGVQLLPAEVAGISYRNNDAALLFLQYVARILHKELVEKIKASPVIGWMMDESTSRTTEKSCIVDVRYLDNYESKTSFYGLMNMEGDGTAENIVNNISELWEKDEIDVIKSCWIASDNASTFTGVHEGVAAQLRKKYKINYLELNTCAAHSFALVGSHAGQYVDVDRKLKTRAELANFEHIIGRIHNYFNRSVTRQQKLKKWQNYLDLPELKFKRLFDIRWSSVRGCMKPIIENTKP
ncbi:unnamed protein product, partial [Didymodactylos carnosus]